MSVRDYQFIVGPETSTLPTATDPSTSSDYLSKGYLEDRSFWGAAVADHAALRALTSTQRVDKQSRKVGVGSPAEEWYFNSANTGTDDGTTILKPNDLGGGSPGRWLIMMSGAGGSSSGASGIEQLTQKLEAEEFNIVSEKLDNSVGTSGRFPESQTYYTGSLLRQHTSSDSVLELAWNAQAFDTASLNYDSATGWSAVGAGASLTASSTAGDFQVGTAGLKFDKNNSATEAGIRYDRTAQTFYAAASNPRLFVYIKLPSVTGLTDVYAKGYADSTSNFRKWTKTTAFAGGAFAVGWNLVVFDLDNTSGTTTGGTGWVYTQASRYFEFGVDTGSSAQTYTGVILDSMYFSIVTPAKLGVIGSEYTLFNNSTKENIVVSSAETDSDGILTLTGALSATYSGGITGSSKSYVLRSTLANTGSSFLAMDNNSSYSGAITTTQEFRTGAVLRGSVAKSYTAIVDVLPVQSYVVTAVGGSTIDVSDPTDQHLNLLNTDTVEIFHPYYYESKAYYVLVASRALTANSSASAGTTTLTLTTTSISVGDIVCKRHLSEAALSCVSSPTTNDNFSALTVDSAPDGIQLINQGIDYPNRTSVYSHYLVGAFSDTYALKNQAGVGPDLTKTGGANLQTAGPPHRLFSGNSFTSANFLSATAATTQPLSGDADTDLTSLLQISFWLYFDAIDAVNARSFLSRSNTAGSSGWYMNIPNADSKVNFVINGATPITSAVNTNALSVGWNHLHLVFRDTGTNGTYIYTNGVRSNTVTTSNAATSVAQPLSIGNIGGSGGPQGATNLRVSDLIFWVNGTELTSAQVQQLYNAGRGIAVGSDPVLRYRYTAAGQNGQKVALRAKLTRSTTAVTPLITKMGAI